jgi:antigen 43
LPKVKKPFRLWPNFDTPQYRLDVGRAEQTVIATNEVPMAKTISSTYSAGFTLSGTASPLVVTSAGTINRTLATGGTNWTIINSGHVSGTATGLFGINLGYFGPTVTSAVIINNSGGVIAGQQYGIITDGATTITNESGGTLSANGNDIVFLQTKGTVFNYGLAINTNATGLYLQGGGSVVNGATGTIAIDTAVSGIGVRLNAVGTVTNSGTIIGGTGGAVGFEATSTANELIVNPGAVFQGGINGGHGTLMLNSNGTAGVLGTFSSSGITNFSDLTSATGLGTISINGFGSTDTIDLLGFAATSETFGSNALVLTNTSNAHATIHIQSSILSTSSFQLSSYDGTLGSQITLLCFVAGTQIATPSGETPVEQLAVGDLVRTRRGQAKPITWIGKGSGLVTRGRRNAATPVIVRKGALADNVPHHDLRVTKGHSLYLDGVLIPVEFLVNHRSILWDDRAQEVTICHIELERHDILLANGAPAESYRDDGNRWLFRNGNTGWDQAPKQPCAPVLTGGPVVDAAWRRLLDRAGPRSLPPMTDDPDLHLIVDGERVDAVNTRGPVRVFCLPHRPETVRIASREVVPAELGIARDPRSLGVALRRLAVRQGTKFEVALANDSRLTDGFHAYETEDDQRWTDGCATIPIEMFARFEGAVEVVLTVAGTTHYPDNGVSAVRVA